MAENPNPSGNEHKRYAVRLALSLLETVKGMNLSSQEIFAIEEKYTDEIFSVLPGRVDSLILGERMRFDRKETSPEALTWTENDLENYLNNL